MNWKSYLAFVVVYFPLGISLSFLAELIPSDPLSFNPLVYVLELLSWVVAAPLAISLAKRVGVVSTTGLLVSSASAFVVLYLAIWGVHQWQSVQAGSSVPVLHMARIGSWPFALDAIVAVLAPLIWHVAVWGQSRSGRADLA